MNNNIRMVTAKAATKEDLCVTLSYLQDALEVAHKLKEKLEHMPIAVQSMLEDKGEDLHIGVRAEFMFLQSIHYLDQLIECV